MKNDFVDKLDCLKSDTAVGRASFERTDVFLLR